ncbi:MAG TPA: hypothetical protein VEK15_08885 [Vicinamibacteria bacterium]|nr:hypothetical protein [Vicinamibacteria bacterium]
MTRVLFGFLGVGFLGIALGCGDDSPSGPSAPSGPRSANPSSPHAQTDLTLTAPTLRAPAMGEAVKELQPELEIGNAQGGSGPRTYIFELALDSAFQEMAVTESGVTEGLGGITKWRVIEPLEAETKYYWRATAVSGGGAGPSSETWEFRIREAFSSDRPTGDIVVFDPLTNGYSVGEVMGGQFVSGGWQPQHHADCLRYQVPTLSEGRIEFTSTNLSTPNPAPGKRMLISMWDPTKGEYTTNPFRMHLQKLDESTAKFDDVRLRWISRGQEHNTGISFYDFEPELVYEWRIEWGSFPGINSQHVKVFLDGFEILTRNYDPIYHPKTHWIELGQCERQETLEQAIFSNVRIGSR